jgi:hypothetical protein
MRKSRVLLAGVAVAAAAAATSAFTAANPITATKNVAGYGDMTASGVTVSNIAYAPAAADASKLHSVVFTVDQDTTGMTMIMTLGSTATPTTPVTGSASTCAAGGGAGPTYAITCTLTADVAISTFQNTGLTVTSN